MTTIRMGDQDDGVTVGEDARLGPGAAYGKHNFSQIPLGGTSLGDDLRGGKLC